MRLLHRIKMMALLLSMSELAICSVPAKNFESMDSLLSSLSAPKQAPVENNPESPVVDKPESTPVVAKTVDPEELPLEMNQNAVEPKEQLNGAAKVFEPKQIVEPKAMPIPFEPKEAMPNIMAKNVTEPVSQVVSTPAMPSVIHTPGPIMPDMTAKAVGTEVAQKVMPSPAPKVAKGSSAVQIVDVHEVASTGLDTLDVDSGGNWLEKRAWYKKGEQLFEVIRTNLQKAGDMRMKFVHEVNQAGQHIDDFYTSINFEKGQIDEMLQAVLQALGNQTQVRGGDLSASERSLKEKVVAEQKQIESISKDLQLISDLDEQIDKTMMKSFKEIDTCRGLETKAWNHFKEIGLELDDKKARVLYYEMENIHKNIEQKMTYLQSNLLPYLQNQLVSKVNTTMAQIKTNLKELDTKGLSLNTLLEKDEHGDLLILKQREKIQEKEDEAAYKAKLQQQTEKDKKTVVQNAAWYTRWWYAIESYLQPVICKLYEWSMIVVCCVQCILCKIQEWICRLLGY